jgi:DNA excision repair protein ERCC-4
MSDFPLRIIVDTREQAPYLFQGYDVIVERAALPTADYQLAGFRAVAERKSMGDLLNSISHDRARFEKELERIQTYDFRCVVVEGNFSDLAAGNFSSRMNPHSAAQTVAAYSVRYAPFFFCGSRQHSEYMVYSLFRQYLRSIVKRYELYQKEQNPAVTLEAAERAPKGQSCLTALNS